MGQNLRVCVDDQALLPHLSMVIDDSKALVRTHVPTGVLSSLCEQRLNSFEAEVQKLGSAPCIDVPYFLCRGLCEDEKKSRAAAVLGTFVYLGCDILDDLHDHELPSSGHSPAHVSLAGSLFLSTLPTLAISDFLSSTDPKSFIACEAVAKSLLTMARGQTRDIESRFNPNLSVEEIEETIILKSGEEMALFCRLSAILADQNEEVQQSCAQFGRDLATALQIVSELTDIFEETTSNDLREGTLTLPLALHFLRLGKGEKDSFCRVWRKSSKDQGVRRTLQNHLKESGALAHSALMIEAYCEKAGKTLGSLTLHPESRAPLEDLLERISQYAVFHLQSFLKKTSQLEISTTLMGM